MNEQLNYAFRRPLDPLKWGSGGTEMDLHAVYVDAATRKHDGKILRERAPILEEQATRTGHELYLAMAHRAFGVIHRLAAEYEPAESRFNRALELFQGLETRWQIGRTLAELGELERSRHNERIAREHFSEAVVEFEILGAAPDSARVRAQLGSFKD